VKVLGATETSLLPVFVFDIIDIFVLNHSSQCHDSLAPCAFLAPLVIVLIMSPLTMLLPFSNYSQRIMLLYLSL